MNRITYCLIGLTGIFSVAASASEPSQPPSLSPVMDPFAAAQTAPTNFVASAPQPAPPPPYAPGNFVTEPANSAPPQIGSDFLVCRDRCAGGFLGGAELSILRPFVSGGLLGVGGASDTNFNPTVRYWLGYQGAEGLGGRVRYWNYNQSFNGNATRFGLDFQALDVELTQAVDFRRWNLLVAGGFRYGSTNLNTSGVFASGDLNSSWSGVGITVAAQAARDLNRTGSLRFVAGGRWSNLFGNGSTTAVSSAGAVTGSSIRDDLVSITELNIGPQYRHRFQSGTYLTANVGGEVQYWFNAVDYGFPSQANVGFAGIATSLSLTY